MDSPSLQDFARQKGFLLPEAPPDGRIRRFRTNGHRRENGWVVCFGSGCAVFGDWRTGEKHVFRPGGNGSDPMTPEEHARLEKQIMAERPAWETEREACRMEASQRAESKWRFGRTGYRAPYLEKKGLDEIPGTKTVAGPGGRILQVPMRDAEGFMWGLQEIHPDGTKKFTTGQKVAGTMFMIGEPVDRCLVCEGVATGMSLHMATRLPVACSFTAGNLQEAIGGLRTRSPQLQITICADNDQFTPGNPGKTAAREAGKKHGCAVVWPAFKPKHLKECPTDFNDLHRLEGLDAVSARVVPRTEKKTSGGRPAGKASLYRAICDEIDAGAMAHRYHVYEPELGTRTLLVENGGGVVHHCPTAALAADVMKWARNGGRMDLTASDCDEAARVWTYANDPVPEPKAVAMRDDSGLCFHRLPFQPDPKNYDEAPLFNELLCRTTNAMALTCWIGSLFFPQSDIQQYVWLYGEGLNGKGALTRFLKKCLGPACFATMPPRGDGVRFWVYNLMGKRLVYFPDCDDDDFPASQLFKMCSGGDTVPAEAKGKQQFNVELNCKFLFSSNNKPNISGQKSDMRRAVFCEMEPIPKEPDPQYENDLWKEAENVIGACMFEYLVACEKHGPIPCEADGLEKVVSENWEFFDKIFNKHFELDNRTEIPENKRHRFSGDELSNVFDNNKLYRPKTQREFRKYLRARHGIKKTRISIQDPSGKWLRKNYYTGAWVRDDFCQDRTDPYADRG